MLTHHPCHPMPHPSCPTHSTHHILHALPVVSHTPRLSCPTRPAHCIPHTLPVASNTPCLLHPTCPAIVSHVPCHSVPCACLSCPTCPARHILRFVSYVPCLSHPTTLAIMSHTDMWSSVREVWSGTDWDLVWTGPNPSPDRVSDSLGQYWNAQTRDQAVLCFWENPRPRLGPGLDQTKPCSPSLGLGYSQKHETAWSLV